MFSLKGRAALITGASRGIGFACAQALGHAGAKVAISGRDPLLLARRVAELESDGIEALALPFEASDETATAAAVARAGDRFGRLDIVMANAGHTLRHPTTGLAARDFSAHLDLHVTAAFVLVREAVKLMTPQRHGRIVLMASTMGKAARPGIPAYVAAKTAVVGLTRAIAVEFAKDGITCNAVAPGFIATDLTAPLKADPTFDANVRMRTPAGRWGMPADVAAAVLFLASDEAAYVNGHTLLIDGGLTASV